jgi:hypothetical protein
MAGDVGHSSPTVHAEKPGDVLEDEPPGSGVGRNSANIRDDPPLIGHPSPLPG